MSVSYTHLDVYKRQLLDSVLNREMIAASDVEEGEYSALVSKIKQILEVLDNHVNSAEQEKEQVKSLVSNMTHQLKTPLANISLYAEILSKEEITSERKTLFSEKMQRQIDKMCIRDRVRSDSTVVETLISWSIACLIISFVMASFGSTGTSSFAFP